MATAIVKFRLATAFEEVEDPNAPSGKNLLERVFSMGDEIDEADVSAASFARLKDLGALYTDEEADQIRNGTYRGADAEILYRFRNQSPAPESTTSPALGEGATIDVSSADAEQIAEHITENKLNVQETVALAGDNPDLDTIEKVLDAEAIASDNSPRKGVTDALEAKMAAASA